MLRGVWKTIAHYSWENLCKKSGSDRYTYYKHGSKSHQGGVADSTDGKVVTIVHQKKGHSHVSFLELYTSKVPPSCVVVDKPFSCTHFVSHQLEIDHGFCTFSFEKLKVKARYSMVKQMFQEAKIVGKFTNHSLRATGATALSDANVPEVIIQRGQGVPQQKLYACKRGLPHNKTWLFQKYCILKPKFHLRKPNRVSVSINLMLHSLRKILHVRYLMKYSFFSSQCGQSSYHMDYKSKTRGL